MTRKAAVAAVVASAACFATLGPLQKWAFSHQGTPGGQGDPLTLLAVRFAIAAIVMAAVQAYRDPSALRLGPGDLARYLGLSLSGYGAGSLCYSFALREVGVSVTTVLLYTYPAMVSVIGWLLLKERFPPRRVAAVALTFVGCALVAGVLGSDVAVNTPGLLLGLGAGLGYAIFNVLSYRTLGRKPRLAIMAYTFGMSSLGMAGISAASGSLGGVAAWDAQAWLAVLAIVAVPTFAAVLLYLGGMRGMGAPQAAVVSTLELPFAVMLAASLAVSERLDAVQIAGAVVVLGGVVLAEWGSAPGEVDGAAAV
jgi:DME family drug/metabolite transporter